MALKREKVFFGAKKKKKMLVGGTLYWRYSTGGRFTAVPSPVFSFFACTQYWPPGIHVALFFSTLLLQICSVLLLWLLFLPFFNPGKILEVLFWSRKIRRLEFNGIRVGISLLVQRGKGVLLKSLFFPTSRSLRVSSHSCTPIGGLTWKLVPIS